MSKLADVIYLYTPINAIDSKENECFSELLLRNTHIVRVLARARTCVDVCDLIPRDGELECNICVIT